MTDRGVGRIAAMAALILVCPLACQPASPDVFDDEATLAASQAEFQRLQAGALAHFEKAKALFQQMGDAGAQSEAAAGIRQTLRAELEQTRAALLGLSDGFPDADVWVEDLTSQVDSLDFWVRRLSPLDLESTPDAPGSAPLDDDEFESPEPPPTETPTTEPRRRVFTIETLPAGVRPPRYQDAASAIAAASARKPDARGQAVYDLLEVLQFHGDDEALVAEAAQQLATLRAEVPSEELLAYLKGELQSADPLLRVFAAREIGSLGLARSVEPLRRAVESEKDERVRARMLAAFRLTPKGATGKELARIAGSRDAELKRAVIAALADEVGGRHGALALAEFAEDKEPEIWRSALDAIGRIGGDAAAGAFGAITRGKSAHPKLNFRCFSGLVTLGTPRAAEELTAHLVRKGKYAFRAADSLVEIGGVAVPALVRALGVSSLRVDANDCLRRISGENMGPTAEKWKDWYRSWLERGTPSLPCYERGLEPWNKGN